MNRIALIALFATGLAASAPGAVISGFELGYLTDNQDAYWAGRVGWQLRTDASLSHQVAIELGYTKHAQTAYLGLTPGDAVTARYELMPLTINYRAETTRADKLGFYFGAGVGQARIKASIPGSGVLLIRRSESTFVAQAFTGVCFKITPNTTADLGAKYLWFNEVSMFTQRVVIDSNLAVTTGISHRF